MKEKGPEQPYTKYSVASSKGCTEFLALCSTECVPIMCPPLPWPPSSPHLGRGLALTSSLPPARGEFRGRPGDDFHPLFLPFFPFEGWARPFCQVLALTSPSSPLSPSLLWNLYPPQPMGRWKFQTRGDEVRAFKLSFFPSCLSVSLKKKNSYSSAYPWDPSRSLTLTRNQKENSPRSSHPVPL